MESSHPLAGGENTPSSCTPPSHRLLRATHPMGAQGALDRAGSSLQENLNIPHSPAVAQRGPSQQRWLVPAHGCSASALCIRALPWPQHQTLLICYHPAWPNPVAPARAAEMQEMLWLTSAPDWGW